MSKFEVSGIKSKSISFDVFAFYFDELHIIPLVHFDNLVEILLFESIKWNHCDIFC